MPLQNSPQETARSNVHVLSAGHYTTHARAIEKGGKNVCQNNRSKPQKRVLAIRKQLMKSNKAMQKGLGRATNVGQRISYLPQNRRSWIHPVVLIMTKYSCLHTGVKFYCTIQVVSKKFQVSRMKEIWASIQFKIQIRVYYKLDFHSFNRDLGKSSCLSKLFSNLPCFVSLENMISFATCFSSFSM